jgi:hypothetical protein
VHDYFLQQFLLKLLIVVNVCKKKDTIF